MNCEMLYQIFMLFNLYVKAKYRKFKQSKIHDEETWITIVKKSCVPKSHNIFPSQK